MNNVNKITNFFSDTFQNDIAIDLGTANTRIFDLKKGLVLNEPSYIAFYTHNGYKSVKNIGKAAKKLYNKEPKNYSIIKPINSGRIFNTEHATMMLSLYLKNIKKNNIQVSPKAIVSYPVNISDVDKEILEDVLIEAGIKNVIMIEEPICAAIGGGLNIEDNTAQIIIDLGAGKISMSVVAYNSIVANETINYGGDYINEQIKELLKTNYQIIIGEQTAENIKHIIGSCTLEENQKEFTVSGLDTLNRKPSKVNLTSSDIFQVIEPVLQKIQSALKILIEKTPPEYSNDILLKGIYLNGGLANLNGLQEFLKSELDVSVVTFAQPELINIEGNIEILKMLKRRKK